MSAFNNSYLFFRNCLMFSLLFCFSLYCSQEVQPVNETAELEPQGIIYVVGDAQVFTGKETLITNAQIVKIEEPHKENLQKKSESKKDFVQKEVLKEKKTAAAVKKIKALPALKHFVPDIQFLAFFILKEFFLSVPVQTNNFTKLFDLTESTFESILIILQRIFLFGLLILIFFRNLDRYRYFSRPPPSIIFI